MMNCCNKKISLQYVKSSEPLLKLIRLTFIFAYGLIYSGLRRKNVYSSLHLTLYTVAYSTNGK